MSDGEFLRTFGEVQRAVGWLGEATDAAAKRLWGLHQRHGAAVQVVVDRMLREGLAGKRRADPDSLLAMLATERISGGTPPAEPTPPPTGAETPIWELRLHGDAAEVEIARLGRVKGASAAVLATLANDFLAAKGEGLPPEDHPTITARKLAEQWEVGEPTVRKRLTRLHKDIVALAAAAGVQPPDEGEIVENLPWHGYRLNPDAVRVVRVAPAPNRKLGALTPR